MNFEDLYKVDDIDINKEFNNEVTEVENIYISNEYDSSNNDIVENEIILNNPSEEENIENQENIENIENQENATNEIQENSETTTETIEQIDYSEKLDMINNNLSSINLFVTLFVVIFTFNFILGKFKIKKEEKK